MKKLISLAPILIAVLFLSACGFDEEKAINDSKGQLEKFFHVYKDGEVIASMNKGDLKKEIHKSFADYFTESYLKQVDKKIDNMTIDKNVKNFKSPVVFFMDDNSVDETVKFNQYELSEEQKLVADKDKKTVKTKLAGVGTPENMFVEVTLKNENGKWKIANSTQK